MRFIIFFIGLIAFIYVYKNTKPKKRKYRKVNKVNYIKIEQTTTKLSEKQLLYRQYLNTEHWKETRLKALIRADYKCQKCHYNQKLQVHHLNYNCLWKEHNRN